MGGVMPKDLTPTEMEALVTHTICIAPFWAMIIAMGLVVGTYLITSAIFHVGVFAPLSLP